MKNHTANITNVVVGVDISKNHIDYCIYPTQKLQRVANTPDGHKSMLKELSKNNVKQIVCEASGGYERPMIKTLRCASYKVWPVAPKRIKAFKDSKGCRAKTDAIDAKMIALFAAQEMSEYEQYILSEEEEKINALTKRRSSLISMIADEKKRHQLTFDLDCKQSIKGTINYLEKQVAKIDKRFELVIKSQVALQKKVDIMQSMCGIGAITAHSLLSLVPELGNVGNKKIAAIIGVAPETRQSGKYIGHAFIRGGRSLARKALYMAALTASRSNPALKEFYDRLISKGKKPKVALVAVMRKMIVILNVMLMKEELWVNYA